MFRLINALNSALIIGKYLIKLLLIIKYHLDVPYFMVMKIFTEFFYFLFNSILNRVKDMFQYLITLLSACLINFCIPQTGQKKTILN